jgi:hypothetical protein
VSGFFRWLFGRGAELYRPRVGSYPFEFELTPLPSGVIRVFINRQPSYGGRSDDLQSTHRYYERGRYFVCIMDHLQPRTYAEARTWADYFAANTVRYIQTGQSFS